ncbi:unnamed protein product, partial [Ectocarpus fasciculatus]
QAQDKVAKRELAEAAAEKTRLKIEKARALLEEAEALVTVYVAPRDELDPYERLEMELNPELTEVEVVLELLGLQVLERLKREAATEVAAFKVEDYISAQTEQQILTFIAEGGVYAFAAGAVKCLDNAKVASAKSEVIGKCKRSINACLHDKPPSKGEWKCLQGARVKQSHLETMLEEKWADFLRAEAVKEAVTNWTEAFPGEGEAAYQALLSVSNKALSELRKAEAQLWLDNNEDQSADMQWTLAGQFEEEWPENTAEGCVQVLDTATYGPDVRLQASSWERLNADAVRQYRADTLERLATEFAVMWESEEQAAREVIAIRERQDAFQGPYAEAWASFHLGEMVAAEGEAAKSRSEAFEEMYPDDTATQAVKIVATRGISSSSNNNNIDADNAAATAGDDPGYEATAAAIAASTAPVLGNDTSLPLPEALAWCALHARAAMMAEESLAIQLAESDSKAAAEQEILERRLKILEDNKLAEANAREIEGDGERDEVQGGQDDSDSVKKRTGSPSAQDAALATATGRQKENKRSPPASPTAVAASKGKKNNVGGVKKSKAQQFAEKQEAERRAKEEEEERQRREAEEAEEALRKQPKSKVDQVRDLLTSKLSERVELCAELLVLLRRAQKKVLEDDSPAKALADPATRPSERQGKHDQLLADRQKALDSIAERIAEAETKAKEARIRFEAAVAAATIAAA